MTANELYEPLKGTVTRQRRARPRWVLAASLCIGALGLAGSLAVILKEGQPRGGEPDIVGTIERLRPVAGADVPQPVTVTAAASPSGGPKVSFVDSPPEPPRSDIPGQSVEVQNGVKVYRPISAGGLASTATVIKVPPRTAAAPEASDRADLDPRLSEPGPYGPLPRVADDGTRPADAYAKPSSPPAADDTRPRIALLVGGLGFDHAAAAQAAATLPAAVTLGFEPYGQDLEAEVREARGAGHEVILQLPMEGFGKIDPPAHMLTADGAKNTDNLDWLLSRLPAYPGVSNLLGGKLLGSEAALRPVLQTLAARGLYVLDDGTAARSLLEPLGRELGLEATRADVAIDARSDAAAIAGDLARLEGLARSRGTAIGTVIARPLTAQAIARFAVALEAHGIVLVPLSEAMRARKTVAAAGLVRQP